MADGAQDAAAMWAGAEEALPAGDWHARMGWIERQADALRHRALCEALMATQLRVARHDRQAVATVAAWLLDELGAGMPEASPFAERLRADAAFWAGFATQPELEAVVAAGLREIERRAFGPRARKRMLAAVWRDMAPGDRAAFLARVDPGGKLRGAA